MCKEKATVLTASGGTTYEWNTGETTASIEVSPNSTSTSYCSNCYLIATGTISDADVVLVTVNELPSVQMQESDVTITDGESQQRLTATGADYLFMEYRRNNFKVLMSILTSTITIYCYRIRKWL